MHFQNALGSPPKAQVEKDATIRSLHAKICKLTMEWVFFAEFPRDSHAERRDRLEWDRPTSIAKQCRLLGFGLQPPFRLSHPPPSIGSGPGGGPQAGNQRQSARAQVGILFPPPALGLDAAGRHRHQLGIRHIGTVRPGRCARLQQAAGHSPAIGAVRAANLTGASRHPSWRTLLPLGASRRGCGNRGDRPRR